MTVASAVRSMPRQSTTGRLIRQRCPKCCGNMALEFDSSAGYYKSCINCGRIEYLHQPSLTWSERRQQWQ